MTVGTFHFRSFSNDNLFLQNVVVILESKFIILSCPWALFKFHDMKVF